jgi:para-nitrobenzyl esterase
MTIVQTKYGKIEGLEKDGVQIWRGVPFAKPPVGELRFMPPQPPEAWEGVRNATKFPPFAPQLSGRMDIIMGRGQPPTDEDCLYLNIWSPAADNANRPVLFWIHGGAFVTGSGATPWYDGRSFATQGDAVVVTINYRLGVLGFLHLAEFGEEYATSGNNGILDQIAALEWVRDNIAAFGGDPNNVTIFGESAGAMSVGTLLATPLAKGLFHKAILQSGAAHNVRSADHAAKAARNVLDTLEFNGTLAELQAVPVEKLLEAATKATISFPNARLFQPVIDGTVLPKAPHKLIAEGSAANVPVLIGTTLDEMNLFTMRDPAWTKLDETGIKARCAWMVGEETFTKVSGYYADQAASSALQKWTALLTDKTFWLPSVRLSEAQINHAPVWMYRFDWASPVFDGKFGSCHALEIPFVWNNLDKAGVTNFTGDSPERQAVANAMHAAWIAFAKTGDPNTLTLPDWSAYNTDHRTTLIFNTQSRVENDPQAQVRQLWEGVI